MQIQERLLVPGLGIVIVLSAIILGVPIVYKVLLGILGGAALATYFAPQGVQVETRLVIAAVGLIILLLVSSAALWLALMAFAAIAALQIPHRGELQRSSATIAWLNELLAKRSSEKTTGEDETPKAGGIAKIEVGNLPGFVRLNVAGIASSVIGVLALASVFMPWVFISATAGGESETWDFTLRKWAGLEDDPAVHAFFFIVLLLGIVGMASVVIPRVVMAIVAIAGFVVAIVSYIYMYGKFEDALSGEIPSYIDASLLPNVGVLLAALCFLAILVLHLIPQANKPRGTG